MIDLGKIKKFPAHGSGSMGSVTDVDSECRFALDADRFVLVYIRGRFIEGTSHADLAIRVDSRYAEPNINAVGGSPKATPFDFVLHTIKDVGTDGDAAINFRIMPNEEPHWTFERGDVIVLEWANPNTQRWALEVALAPVRIPWEPTGVDDAAL